MIYASIDVDLRDNSRAIEAGLAAMGLWTWAMLYTRGQRRDGSLPRSVILRAAWGEPAELEMAAARLVKVGLWIPTDDGWRIHNYKEKNQTPEQIQKSIDAAAERKRKSRAQSNVTPMNNQGNITQMSRVTPEGQSRVTAGSGSGSGFVFNSGSEIPESSGLEGPRAAFVQAAARDPLGGTFFLAAYAAGIAKGKGSPYAPPGGPFAAEGLSGALDAHGRARDGIPLKGEALAEWVTKAAAEFASDVASRPDPKAVSLYSSFGPKGFARWLNERRLKPQLKREEAATMSPRRRDDYADLNAKYGVGK